MKKRILITGAGGFVGSYLIKELKKDENNEVYGSVYKSTTDISSLLPKEHILTGDLTQKDIANNHVKTANPDIIYHLAALSVVHNSTLNALSTLQGNTAISYNLFEAIRAHAPKSRTIAVCSANVYGAVDPRDIPISESTPFRPLNPYAISKVTQEMLALQSHLANGLDVVIVRAFNHSGPGQTQDFVLPKLARQVVAIEKELALPKLELGSGSSVRDFTDVRDMVKAYVLTSAMGVSGEVYNIGSGIGVSIRNVAEILQSLSKKRFEIIEKPELSRVSDVPVLVADTTKFKDLTGYFPVISLERTISDILEYERNNYHE
ncbi:MAG: GDP-mannose 4,6-dehydratase [Candidatus Microgenomates bacterium]